MRIAAIAIVAGGLTWLTWGKGTVPLGQPGAHQRRDFQWHGHLTQGQTITIRGVNGDVRADAAEGPDVEVTAVKHARRSDPDEVRIEVVPGDDGVTICAIYPTRRGDEEDDCRPGGGGHSESRRNDTEVEFTVHVPRGVNFQGRTVNGDVIASALDGNVEAHSVNGDIDVSTSGYAEGSSVNGEVRASLGRSDWAGTLEFSSVNGPVTVVLPASVAADISAGTVNGSIDSDFPLTVQGRFSAKHLTGTIGGGGRELRLHTVNGSINLKRG
jgi:DUF4097 and DUF4098 domain-containing protein YvlB